MSKNIADQEEREEIKFLRKKGRIDETVRRLIESGLSLDDFQSVIDDQSFRAELVRQWKSRAGKTSTLQHHARLIMGKNFIGIKEVSKHLKVTFADDLVKSLEIVRCPKETLEYYKNSHLLVAGLPVDINRLSWRVPDNLFKSIGEDSPHLDEKVYPGWFLIQKGIMPSSNSIPYSKQLLHIGFQEVPKACELAYTISLYYLITGEKLLEDVYSRCSDDKEFNIRVGNFREDGFEIERDDYRNTAIDCVGVMPIWRL